MTIQHAAKLNNGVEIPLLGLGTWQSTGQDCENAVKFALKHGYDLIDTAQDYSNEHQVGNGWKSSGRTREEIFITTKIGNSNQGYENSLKSFEKSLNALQTDYVDLLLIHWPDAKDFSRTIETWRALIELNEKGLCRSIGVSNFTTNLIENLIEGTAVVPSVNQVEFHAFFYQKELLHYCRDKNIQIEAYSPIARGKHFDNEVLQRVAKKYEKSPAQLMLAWLVNHKLVAIPKSIHEERILENSDIFFELEKEDLQTMDALEPQRRLINPPWAPETW